MTQSLARSDLDQSLESLRKVLYEIQAATDIDSLCTTVSAYIQGKLGYELVWLGLYDSSAERLEGPWQRFPDTKVITESIAVLPGDLFDQVLLTRRTATVPSLQEESRTGSWQTLAKKIEIQGAILQNIRYQKESLGVLLIGTSKWGIHPHQDETHELAILANTLGSTIQYLKSQQPGISANLSVSSVTDQALPRLLQALAHQYDWEKQLNQLMSELVKDNPELISGLFLLDPDTGDFVSYGIQKPQVKQSYRKKAIEHTLTCHQHTAFFRNLERQTHLAVSDVNSSIGTTVPLSLVTLLEVRSLLFQPILVEESLKGFFFLGQPEPTTWTEAHKQKLQLLSTLVELTYPRATPVLTIDEESGELQSRLNACELPSPLAAIEDWNRGLQSWFLGLTRQFACQWSLHLKYDTTANAFFLSQYFSTNRRTSLDQEISFGPLSDVDEKLLVRQDTAIALDNLKDDLRFMAWRDQFLAQGIQSILVSRVSQGSELTEVLILGNTAARIWDTEDTKDLYLLASKLYQAHDRRKMHINMLSEQRLNHIFRKGLQALQSTKSSQNFIEKAGEILVDLFEISTCVILLCSPNRTYGKVKVAITPGVERFSVQVGQKVSLKDDLLQQIISVTETHDIYLNPIEKSSLSLTPETENWLSTQGHWSLIGIPIQPQPRQPIFGTIILANPVLTTLESKEKELLSDFARHLGWVLWSSHLNQAWCQDYEALHTMHWFQQKNSRYITDTIQQTLLTLSAEDSNPSTSALAPQLQGLHQTLESLDTSHGEFLPDLPIEFEPITLVRLLREILDRLETVFAQRQIWVQVHHLKQSNLALKSSKVLLTYVLDELLNLASARSEVGGRIDIWCQMNHPKWLDLSITDNGKVDARLLRDLRPGHNRDRLKASPLNTDLGHRLLACKSFVQRLGGKLEYQSLEDGRTLTRLTLPCINS